MEQSNRTPQFFIQRHVSRINQRLLGLSGAHDFIMNKMALLNSTLTLLKKTHGFFACRFNSFLKDKIQALKDRIAKLQLRCRAVLAEIGQLGVMLQNPFRG